MTRGTSLLLRGAVSMPFLYLGTLILSSLFFPGYRHVTQYARELGSTDAPYPMLFNGGILLTAAAGRRCRTLMAMRWRGRCQFGGIAAPGMGQ